MEKLTSPRWNNIGLSLTFAGLAAAAGLGFSSTSADAYFFADVRALAHVSIAVPVQYYAPGYGYRYYGAPYYAAPPPVYVAPPIYAAPPAVYVAPPAQGPAPPQSWYYCDNPKGYYPHVQQCPGGWRPVAPTPP